MDAVILAGGKSERLRGIVPPYFKPFIVVGGKSLLVSAVDSAEQAGAERIAVVATGENALPVWQLIGHRSNVRVVLSDRGVGDAVYRGAEVCKDERLLVLMSDNVHGDSDVKNVVNAGRYAIGVRRMPYPASRRFTRFNEATNRWVEGDQYGQVSLKDTELTWCGPLVISRTLTHVLCGEGKIGPHLSDLAPSYWEVDVHTKDIGVPDVVTEMTS